jgi:hypothetical protein
MKVLISRVLTGWHPMRWVQLVLAAVFLTNGVMRGEGIALAAAAFFGIQALFNVGCCAMGSCATGAAPRTPHKVNEDISYEEVK